MIASQEIRPAARSAPIATPDPNPVSVNAAGATDRGRERERNEDAYLIATLQRSILVHDATPAICTSGWFTGSAGGTLLAVADGMGGMGSGDVASEVAVRTVVNYLLNVMPWEHAPQEHRAQRTLPGVRDQLAAAVAMGDAGVRGEAARPGVSPRLGTTLTLAYVTWPFLYVVHVGDSRCYLSRGDALLQLTTDHTVAEQIRERGIPEQDVPAGFSHVLWNALGGESPPSPQIQKVDLEVGDTLLLCSDGLTKHLLDSDLLPIVRQAPTPADACQQLITLANARGGTDNITVVVARGVVGGRQA